MKVTATTLANIIILSMLSFFISSIMLVVMMFVPENVFINNMYVFFASVMVWLGSFIFLYDLPNLIIEAEQEFYE